MTARAESTVFWPGITLAISALRATCNQSPSRPSAPPHPMVPLAYPFQCICADFFHYRGVNYLVVGTDIRTFPRTARRWEGARILKSSRANLRLYYWSEYKYMLLHEKVWGWENVGRWDQYLSNMELTLLNLSGFFTNFLTAKYISIGKCSWMMCWWVKAKWYCFQC